MTTTHVAVRPARRRSGALRDWTVVGPLLALGAIPLIAGVLRIVQLAGGPALIPADGRISGFPLPVVAHIVGSAIFVGLGAIQLAPRLRRRFPTWHRRAGRVAFAAGLVVAVSALWMTVIYPYKTGTGDLLFVMRLVFGGLMGAGLVLALAAVRRGDIAGHRAWMIRAYAIGLAAGTQAFTEGISQAIFGIGVLQDDVAKTAGWIVNLAVAEWIVRRRPTRKREARVSLHPPEVN